MTIREVAKKAGVSTATVSRLINENGFVSKEARKKILQAFKETGYDPANRRRRTAGSTSSGLSHNNVVMVWNTGKYYEQTLTGQNMMQGITEALQQLGATLTVAHLNGNDEIPTALLNGKFDGVFIHGSKPSPAICKHLKKHPVIWLLKQGSFDFGDRIQPDHSLAGELSCDWMIQQGCRNLCCMTYTVKTSKNLYATMRADSFQSSAERSGTSCCRLTQPEPDETANPLPARAAAAARLVENFAQLNPRPDGIFVTNELGPYIHAELLKQNIIPMKDLLLIAGEADICYGHHLDPMPATIQIFSRDIGKQAVEMLLQRVKNPDMPQITCALKPQLLIPA
ncbi:LacI family DNA-binding transcriptional regulator [Tichowtungia aerotolerans]|uniref:LacI family DNA-binding transcriptional regulator n=1 Tax=Tichowtungia aerotolerans TaxID=2697043 RepID=A0A6P1MHU4_9BACT|nr:LacI family DNA-binding transcriptional regulator [Tichowtungia aerotolerans]QHI70625.1 LacI family DNA-binding transcriptional regulator [Tichowtungia aerotolerans]